jgi:two-component system heavy metal sensor histidine kinase CusS
VISIRRTLTLGFAGATLAVTATAGALLEFALRRELDRRDAQVVEQRLQLLDFLLDEAAASGSMSDTFHKLDDLAFGQPTLRIWLAQEDGSPLYGGEPPPPFDPAEVRLQRLGMGERPVLGLKHRMPGRGELPPMTAVVALDTSPTAQTMKSFRHALAIVVMVGAAVSGVLGALIARSGLRPLGRLSQSTLALGPSNLAARIDVAALPMELLELGAAFNRLLERVQGGIEQITAFNSNVAHELRTPLTNLILGTQVALQQRRNPSQYEQQLGENLEQMERLRSLVNAMLFLATADSGQLPLEAETIDLRAQLRDVFEFYEAMLDERSLTVRIDGDASLNGSRVLIRQALSNLVSNAIRHAEPDSELIGRLSVDGSSVGCHVENQGARPAVDDLARLFERFFVGDSDRSAGGRPRHGLGLAIVAAIVAAHGGQVEAVHANGRTRIGFRVPADAVRSRV